MNYSRIESTTATLKLAGKQAMKLVPNKAVDNMKYFFQKMGNSKLGDVWRSMNNPKVWKFLKETGYNGIGEEMMEEWYGNAIRSVTIDPNALKEFATWDNQLMTLVSFLPMAGGGAIVSSSMSRNANAKYRNSVSALEKVLRELGKDDEGVKSFFSSLDNYGNGGEAELRSMVGSLTDDKEKGDKLIKSVTDYLYNRSKSKVYNDSLRNKDDEEGGAGGAQVESEQGVEGDDYAGTARLKDGREVTLQRTSKGLVGWLDDGNVTKVTDDMISEYIPEEELSESDRLEDIPEEKDDKMYLNGNEVNKIEILGDGYARVTDVNGGVAYFTEEQVKGYDEYGNWVEDEDGNVERVDVQDSQEEAIQSKVPTKEDGTPDYDAMSPDMFAVEFEKEFGADAAKTELEQMVSDIDDKVDKLQKKSPTNRNERAENMREIARLKGERENVLKALERYGVQEDATQEKVQEEQPVFSNEEEAVRWVMENSEDVGEVLGTYESVKELQSDATLPRWQQELQGIKINPESFYKEGDRNLATPELKRGWLSKGGRSIDEVAHDLSNYGVEVTPQDVVDFMLEHPSGKVRQRSSELDELGKRFSELATKAAGVKIGKPDSPTGKLFVENMRTSNDIEQLRGRIEDAQRAEEEVLRSMAEQRDAERESGQDIKPIGKGFFGNIYDQFKGKANEAIRFLMKQKDGEAIGALHHPQVGDIDLVWGNDKAGLMKIAKKHPEMLDDLQGKIDNMEVISSSDNRIILESPTDKAVISKNIFDEEGKQWLLTAYEKKNADISGSSIDIEPEPEGKQNGTAPLQNESVSSTVKDMESFSEKQENDIRFRFIGEKGAANLDKAEEATTRLDNLNVAREMEKSGKDAKAIKLATGWERGADGKWRYEENDFEYRPLGDANKDALLKRQPWYDEFTSLLDRVVDGEELTNDEEERFSTLTDAAGEVKKSSDLIDRIYLDDYVKDDNLFKAYPELKTTNVVFGSYQNEDYAGAFYEGENKIVVNLDKANDVRSVLAHEIQHVIQRIEGFALGGNPKGFNKTAENVISDIVGATNGKLLEGGGFDNTPQGIFSALNRKTAYGGTILRDNSSALDAVADKYGYETIFDLVNDIDKFKSSVQQYRSLAGEVEARNVQSRLNMTDEERRNSLASETEDVAREDQIFLNDALGVSASMDDSVEDVNRRFNEELDAFENGEHKGDLHLGMPGDVLLASGLNDTEMYITPKTLKDHFKKHGLKVGDIKNLPSALRNPLLVYEWGDKAKSLVVITNIEHGDERITAAIKLERNGKRLEVNELASVHPKDNRRFINDMINAKHGGLEDALRYVSDKTKALDWLGLVPPKGTASLTKQELDIANVIKDFENPTLEEGKIVSAVESLASELNVPVRIVRNVDEIKDEDSNMQRKKRGSKGWYDPKTGEVVVVLPNADNARDAQATMLHEVVGHKGIRGLFGDRIGEFTKRVLDSMPEEECEVWSCLMNEQFHYICA